MKSTEYCFLFNFFPFCVFKFSVFARQCRQEGYKYFRYHSITQKSTNLYYKDTVCSTYQSTIPLGFVFCH